MMGSGYFILNAAGDPEPVNDGMAWARWYEQASTDRSRIIAQDRDEGPDAPTVVVSTVFLGLDHRYGDGPPVLWETMILGGPDDQYQERYTSRDDAIRGHARACARARALKGSDR